jgi:hypothetical protein
MARDDLQIPLVEHFPVRRWTQVCRLGPLDQSAIGI